MAISAKRQAGCVVVSSPECVNILMFLLAIGISFPTTNLTYAPILAKGEKLLEFFEEIVRKDLTEYIEIMFQVGVSIDPETLIEGVRRMRERSPEYQANLERALTNLFTFSPESAERISPFREILEERERNTAIQAKREALSLLLVSKFGSLPPEIVSGLEAVRDVDEMDRLYRRALQAQTLEEVGIKDGTDA